MSHKHYKVTTRWILAITFIASCPISWAGTGWYVDIFNNSLSTLTVSYGGSDGWYCNDFCGTTAIAAGQSHKFYTEKNAGDSTTDIFYGIQGINLKDAAGHSLHVEFVMNKHPSSGTQINSTDVYGHFGLPGRKCSNFAIAAITASDPSMVTTTMTAGNNILCGGSYGTVTVTINFNPPSEPSSNP
ncbi:hypothetical protein [Endozoicomonas arenosclerae]|uniref:hypothetical protein n=1 Tax=Endozoicomonas arenosclerae TaxID=1633495 RepID=UPI000785D975|nr:hypothetical protein [Endozoicomonas arenosclerae]